MTATGSAVDAVPGAPQRGSISTRLVAATLLVSVLVSLLVSLLQLMLAYEKQTEAARQRLQEIGTSLVPSLAASVWLVDGARIELLLDGIAQLPAVAHVQLRTREGEVYERGTLPEHALLQRRYPLRHEEGQVFELGTLDVELSDRQIVAQLRGQAASIALTTAATLVCASLLMLLLFRAWVTRHLVTMADYARALNLAHLDRPLVLRGKSRRPQPDELDEVAASVNRMRETLLEDLQARQRIEAELSAHRERLEELVSERTLELLDKTRQLQLQSSELASRNQELEAYAHTVAHDLKTPLTTVVGLSALLANSAALLPAEKATELAGSVHRTALKMASIIDALLMLASLRRSGQVELQVLDMAAIVDEARQRLAGLAEQRQAEIRLPAQWPRLLGQPQWVEEVWSNYLSNALKYGGAPPRIELGADAPVDGRVRCWVRDHGPGIEAGARERLFTAFERLDPRVAEGHGLGLSIVARIVRRLGGEVGCDPAPGGGSRFWFSLPQAPD